MEIIRVRSKIYQQFNAPSVALGNFDGVHLGHQKILKRTAQTAHRKNRDAMVYTFDPHPRVVLKIAPEIRRITTLRERSEILEHLGINVLVLAEFTPDYANQTPEDFSRHLLSEELGAEDIFIGANYRFGKNRSGNAETLRTLAPELGFRVHVIEPVIVDDARVSSSRIRDHLIKGDIGEANRLLGREFTVEGRVVHGHHRGKKLGFPTANIKPDEKLHPPDGVYAAYCRVSGRMLPAVMNIGSNPTFKARKVSYEVHILDFEEDLYGESIKVYLVDRLRAEETFESVDELVTQIRRDVEKARSMLTVFPSIP
jgi:riboflavin kinase / FMN adenylyltransferase